MKRLFRIEMDEERGSLGFIENCAPDEFEPLGGMGTAHDCLEHFPGDNGSIDHEFLALGAMVWVRGQGGYFTDDPAKSVSAEMTYTLWRAFVEDGTPMQDPKPNNRLEIDETFFHATSLAKKEIFADYEGYEDLIDNSQLNRFLHTARYWLQVGYNRARRRYSDPWKVVNVFRQIEEQVNAVLKYDPFIGEEYEIQYCISKSTASVIKLEQNYFY